MRIVIRHNPTTCAAGMTLAELVLAMTVTAIIALAVATMALAASTGHAHSRDRAETTQRAQSGLHRISALLRGAKLITAAGGNRVVLWARDEQDPGQINLAEIIVLDYDPAAGTLTQTRAHLPSLPSPQNQIVPLALLTDPAGVLSVLGPADQRSTAVIADGLAALVIEPDAPAPLSTGATIYQHVRQGQVELHLSGAAQLRAPAAGHVELVEGQFTLRQTQ